MDITGTRKRALCLSTRPFEQQKEWQWYKETDTHLCAAFEGFPFLQVTHTIHPLPTTSNPGLPMHLTSTK